MEENLKKGLISYDNQSYSIISEGSFISNYDVKEFYSQEKEFFKIFPINKLKIHLFSIKESQNETYTIGNLSQIFLIYYSYSYSYSNLFN